MAKRKTARQIAAARRNIVKAQKASADSRRGKSRSRKSGHHYGTGKTGRRQAKRNKYGSRKHGISIAQQTRRDRRSRKWKNRGAVAFSVATTGAAIYGSYHSNTSPGQRAANKKRVKQAGKDFRNAPSSAKLGYRTGRQVRMSRRNSAKLGARMGYHTASGKVR